MKEKFNEETDKPAIEWLEKVDIDDGVGIALLMLGNDYFNKEVALELHQWLYVKNENKNRLVRALVNGYEIEEEKFRVVLKEGTWQCRTLSLVYAISSETYLWTTVLNNDGYVYDLTEKEIRNVNPVYMELAKKVE
ncbi:hypothetical protein RD055328_08590 [Companilactobacillus sp. RD055328]|uniref:DUF1642 domain-containing protein n=1 Tax=Companilactobacillus sp. RD055328 TaxID=2916634 RepID=UPI001FC80450|nr:DUF1642 domain-containing protein [Companilactobacillus sp. RD055328]GKQ42936.1 hypothetical protein RD055328_08590 [Companilactobacillus sp. RD055328]